MASFVSAALGLGRRSARASASLSSVTGAGGGSGWGAIYGGGAKSSVSSSSFWTRRMSNISSSPSTFASRRLNMNMLGVTQAQAQPLSRGVQYHRSFMTMASSFRPQSKSLFLPQQNNSAILRMPSNLQQQQRGMASKKHKRVVKLAKGFRGRANSCYSIAIRRVEKAWQYAYRDRKVRRRDFRKLWITRVAAGVRQHSLSYSRFIHELNNSPVILDRKVLANLASQEPFSFKAVVDVIGMTHEAGAQDAHLHEEEDDEAPLAA